MYFKTEFPEIFPWKPYHRYTLSEELEKNSCEIMEEYHPETPYEIAT